MFLMWIVPLLLISLVVYANSDNNLVNILEPIVSRACPHCNQSVQNDWKVCPQCGKNL
jgi:hypothetical protein